MTKKPASLSSDLLARKGAAAPASLEPDARTTDLAATTNPVGAAEAAADPQQPLDQPLGERPTAVPEPHVTYLPDQPDPAEAWTTLRLAAGMLAVVAVAGGALLAISFNRDDPSVAPVAPQFAAPLPDTPLGTPTGHEAPADRQLADLTPPGTGAADADTPDEIVAVRREVFTTTGRDVTAAPTGEALTGDTLTGDTDQIITGSIGRAAPPPGILRETVDAAETPDTPARIAALPRTPQPATRAAATPKEPRLAEPGDYLVQLGSVQSEEAAQQEWTKLQRRHASLLDDKGLDLQRADLGDKGIYYRVRTGAFNSKAEANALCQKLKAAGQACLVRRVPASG